MGVWSVGAWGMEYSRREFLSRGEESRGREIAGSPYAIIGYNVSEKLGGEKALSEFRRRLNERGIKLVLDFVPNHTALDHPWVETHPEFYVTTDAPHLGATTLKHNSTKWYVYGFCGVGEPWVDTLQLDYRNPDLRRAMMNELLSISARCDGVRCDMAMLQLNDVFAETWQALPNNHSPHETEFWSDSIAAVRRCREDFLFLAEVYWGLEARLQELDFDFTYDKRLYDRIVGKKSDDVTSYLYSLPPEFIARSAHFIENHDEQRIATILSRIEQQAAALLIVGLPGMRFIHEGQMNGNRIYANVHYGTRFSEAAVAFFYPKLFDTLPRTAIGNGEWYLLQGQPAWEENATHQHVALVQWQREPSAFDLVVVNLSPVQSQCYVPLKADLLTGARWRFADLLSDEVHERDGNELAQRGLYLDLVPHAAQLFHAERY